MNKKLKRFGIAAAALAAGAAGAVEAPRLAVHHDAVDVVDSARKNRSIPVDVYVRRDKQLEAELGVIDKLPVVIISHGNTVKSTEYSYIAKRRAEEGYLVLSIQHDLPNDPPLAAARPQGSSYLDRIPSYERGEKNILAVIKAFKKDQPFADYDHLTLIGHSQGGDISTFYSMNHPGTIRAVITLDNLRYGFAGGKTLTLRGTNEKPFLVDPGVVPCPQNLEGQNTMSQNVFPACVPPGLTRYKVGNLTVHMTGIYHNNMKDGVAADAQKEINGAIDEFLKDKTPLLSIRPEDYPARSFQYNPMPSQPY
jgi:dienelactone hydrolase